MGCQHSCACHVDDVRRWGGVGWNVKAHIHLHVNKSHKVAAMRKFMDGNSLILFGREKGPAVINAQLQGELAYRDP